MTYLMMCRYPLSDAVLQILKDMMLFFSCRMPNLTTVIPAMDYIDTVFTNVARPTSDLSSAVQAAIEIVKKTLNRYYSLTDASDVYRIAMDKATPPVLQPT
jgi:hypothetical protein